MITEVHLNQWLREIIYQLNGISGEINPDKVLHKGINVGFAGESWVSFEYLNEKQQTIRKLVKNILFDMEHDKN